MKKRKSPGESCNNIATTPKGKKKMTSKSKPTDDYEVRLIYILLTQ